MSAALTPSDMNNEHLLPEHKPRQSRRDYSVCASRTQRQRLQAGSSASTPVQRTVQKSSAIYKLQYTAP